MTTNPCVEKGGSEDDQIQTCNDESWKDEDFLSFGADEEPRSSQETLRDTHKTPQKEEKNKGKRQFATNAYTSNNTSLTSTFEIPPWMDHPHPESNPHQCRYTEHRSDRGYKASSSRGYQGRGGFSSSMPPLVNLHNEIVNFENLMEPRPDELEKRQELIKLVKELVLECFPDASVEVFGSTATGLLLPSSDIDFCISLPEWNTSTDNKVNDSDTVEVKKDKTASSEEKEMEDYDVKEHLQSQQKSSPYIKLAETMVERWKDEVSHLQVIENTRIPIVKFKHKPTSISADICINQTLGVQAAELMKRFLDVMPPLRPLTYVLKYFIASRGLNEPYTGGIGSYMLQLMIVSFLQHRERYLYNVRRTSGMYNLGALLLEFMECYGMDFNYITTGISVRHDGQYFCKGDARRKESFYNPQRPFSLALENPLEPTSDVGKQTFRMPIIARSFQCAFQVLLSHVGEPPMKTMSILASILSPTEEMTSRKTQMKVWKINKQIEQQGYQSTISEKESKQHDVNYRTLTSDNNESRKHKSHRRRLSCSREEKNKHLKRNRIHSNSSDMDESTNDSSATGSDEEYSRTKSIGKRKRQRH